MEKYATMGMNASQDAVLTTTVSLTPSVNNPFKSGL